MKLIKSLQSDLISFRVDGHTLLEITPEGIEVGDAVAQVVEERLGSQVSISEWEAPKKKDQKEEAPKEEAKSKK